jgi:protein-L-isoaspartate(D-aspartate) O-methyltransferase
MIQEQIIERGISCQKTIEGMRKVPRHRFLPQSMWSHAYDDRPQTIGHGQTISQPYIVALMTSQFGHLPKGSRILEVGSGCGYQTAILVEMGFEVHSIEIVPALAEQSQKVLKELGLMPTAIINADGKLGIPESAPFNGIIAAACGDDIPSQWIEQLAAGGVIVAPIEGKRRQLLIRIDHDGQKLKRSLLCTVRFVKLI